MRNSLYITALLVAAVLAAAAPVAAQIDVGDDVKLSLGGTVSAGYSGAFTDIDGSSHGLDLGGNATLHGSYYNPNFLNFDFQPYYRRSQNNSIYQSLDHGKGFNGVANFFSGSKFPGSVSYSWNKDTIGQFGIPGLDQGVVSHSSGGSYGISWSALLPDLPTLHASFTSGGNDATVFGANTESHSSTKNLTLQSTYKLLGFNLVGQYTHLNMGATFPSVFGVGEATDSTTGSNAFSFIVGHDMPWRGYWTAGWNRSSYTADYEGEIIASRTNGSVNDYNTVLSLNPTNKLGVSMGTDYNDNAYASLQQRIIDAGGLPLPNPEVSSRTFTTYAQAGYSLFRQLALYGRVNHYEVYVPGRPARGITQFGGNAAFNFAQRLLGSLTFSVGLVDTMTDGGNSGASLVGNVNFLRRIQKWEISSMFGYTQQVQTLNDVYTTSLYSYGASVRRRFNSHASWSGSFIGHHSGLQQFEGFSSRSESFTSSIHYGIFGLNGQYSQSRGTSILTPTGLIDVPGVPAPILEPILYDAKSYGGGASVRPFRRCSVTVNYNKANSGTAGPSLNAGFNATMFNTRLEYRLRRLNVEGNYTRFSQTITTGTLPATLNSYYIRLSRWFNIF